MFQVSRQVDYAVQFVSRLAQLEAQQTLSLRTFSNESTISFLFLQKIARSLKQAGIIDSTKGARGGYFLVMPAGRISLMHVVEAIEGPYGVVDCVHGMCNKTQDCKTKEVWLAINRDIVERLRKTPVVTQ